MNVEIEMNDFLRNSIPGYIFVLVFLSFDMIDGKIDFFQSFNGITGTELVIGLIIAGFPIGFIIQNLYRALFNLFGLERPWEHREMVAMEDALGHKVDLSKIGGNQNLPDEKVLSWLLDIFLMEKNESKYRERSRLTISWVHSTGASIIAIFLGFGVFILSSLWLDNCFLCCGSSSEVFLLVVIFWGSIALGLLQARTVYLHHHQIMSRHFIFRNIERLRPFLEGEKNKDGTQ